MSDFVTGFWSVYIAGITLVSILACAVLLYSNSTRGAGAGGPAPLHAHVWDEDLREYDNPLPRWWMWLFYLTIVFGLGYLALYPGLGTYQGSFGWSSTGQYEQEMRQADAQYGPLFAKYLQQDLRAVAADAEARRMGERLFLTYCAQCHGSDARGAKGFHNLTDHDWLYGGEPAQIETTILQGRNGVMPRFGPTLGAEPVKDVAHYVRSLSDLSADSIRVARGRALFAQNCAACHGADARGNQAIGAPNLTDRVWLYGSSEPTIIETVSKGRNNQMPAHKEFLGEAKVHLLAAYVYQLGTRDRRPGTR